MNFMSSYPDPAPKCKEPEVLFMGRSFSIPGNFEFYRRTNGRFTRKDAIYGFTGVLLPYGKWTCAPGDGREILFNRGYLPLFQRRADRKVHLARPGEWVKWATEEFLYEDRALHTRDGALDGSWRELEAWGLAAQMRECYDEFLSKYPAGRKR